MPGLSSAEKKVRLAKMSYQDFLLNVAKVDPQVLWFFRHFGEGNFCVGADATPALFAMADGPAGILGPAARSHARGRPGRTARASNMAGKKKAAAQPCIFRTATPPSRGCWCAG